MLDFNSAPLQGESTTPSLSPDQAFLEELARHGLTPSHVVADGQLHRFDIEGSKKAGWYVFYNDNIPAGAFGAWNTGLDKTWCYKQKQDMTAEELQAYTAKIEAMQEQREQERGRTQQQAREKAQQIWQASRPAPDNHPYPANKNVKAHGLKVDDQGRLVVPVQDIFGELQGLQFIAPDGSKLFLPGTSKKGNYYVIHGSKEVFCCEGYATAATIHAATGGTAVVAFDAGNLQSVAENIKSKYSSSPITICADNDQFTTRHDGKANPGLVYATEAAEAIRARLVCPEFADLTGKPTDFNDLASREGLDAVKIQIMQTPACCNILDWPFDAYEGEAKPRRWLVEGVFTLASVAVLAAMGDSGKGMLSLDLARRVAGVRADMLEINEAFGHSVIETGSAVIFTAEDDFNEVHRRLNNLGSKDWGDSCKGKLFIVPLPNAGGPIPLVTPGKSGPETSQAYHDIKKQLLSIPDLKLVVFDPLASFVTADINADPAVGAYAFGLLSSLAIETGATVLVAHHMAKSNREVTSAEMARSLIRGSSAIVDGARAAYVLWPARPARARQVCKIIDRPYQPNKVFLGALVKSNGPGDRNPKTFVRNERSGLLEVWDDVLKQIQPGPEAKKQLLVMDIREAAADGQPFTKSGAPGVYERRHELCDQLQNVGKGSLHDMVEELLAEGEIVKCVGQGSTVPKWLDVPEGPFSIGTGEIEKGARTVCKSVRKKQS